jgi:hypothetical protein
MVTYATPEINDARKNRVSDIENVSPKTPYEDIDFDWSLKKDKYQIFKNDIEFQDFSQISFMKQNHTLINFTDQQAHEEIFGLTENFYYKDILTAINNIEEISTSTENNYFQSLLTHKWFEPVVEFQDVQIQNKETFKDVDLEDDVIKYTTLRQVLNNYNLQKQIYLSKSTNQITLTNTSGVLWNEGISDQQKLLLYLQKQPWEEAQKVSYQDTIHNNMNDSSKNLLHFKRFLENDKAHVTGFYVNNNTNSKNYRIFDTKTYLENITDILSKFSKTIPIKVELHFTKHNELVEGVITDVTGNNITVIQDKTNEKHYYNFQHPMFLIYDRSRKYDYKYNKSDFYTNNIVFRHNQDIELIDSYLNHFVPDVSDYLNLNQNTLKNIKKTNFDLDYFHNTSIQKLSEIEFSLFIDLIQKHQTPLKPFVQYSYDSVILKSKYISKFDVLNFDQHNLVKQEYKFFDNFETNNDSDLKRFNHLKRIPDKGLSILYNIQFERIKGYLKSYETKVSSNSLTTNFKETDIYNIENVKLLKKNNSVKGKQNFDIFNQSKSNQEEVINSISTYYQNTINFFNKKHTFYVKDIINFVSIENVAIFDETMEEHIKMDFYQTENFEYSDEEIMSPDKDKIYELVKSVGLKLDLNDMKNLIQNIVEYTLNVKRSSNTKTLSIKQKYSIKYAFIIIWAQIVDKPLQSKSIINKEIYSLDGFPIDMIDEKQFNNIDQTTSSLLLYMTTHMMLKLNEEIISKDTNENIMQAIFETIINIFNFSSMYKLKLVNTKINKQSNNLQNEIDRNRYLKFYKPFNQDISLIKYVKQVTEPVYSMNKDISKLKYNVSDLFYIKSDKINTRNNIVKKIHKFEFNQGILHNIYNPEKTDYERIIENFVKQNKWIQEDSRRAFNIENEGEVLNGFIDKKATQLTKYFDKVFLFTEFINILDMIDNISQPKKEKNEDLLNIIDTNIDTDDSNKDINTFMNEITQFNINRYLGHFIHNKNNEYNFIYDHADSDFFSSEKTKNIFKKYQINGIHELIVNLPKNFVIRIILDCLLSSITMLLHELFVDDYFINLEKTLEFLTTEVSNENEKNLTIVTRFISKSLKDMSNKKTKVDKQILLKKYSEKLSAQRREENIITTNMSQAQLEVYLASRKVGLDFDMLSTENQNFEDTLTYDNDNDYGSGFDVGDGDGDYTFDDNE